MAKAKDILTVLKIFIFILPPVLSAEQLLYLAVGVDELHCTCLLNATMCWVVVRREASVRGCLTTHGNTSVHRDHLSQDVKHRLQNIS